MIHALVLKSPALGGHMQAIVCVLVSGADGLGVG